MTDTRALAARLAQRFETGTLSVYQMEYEIADAIDQSVADVRQELHTGQHDANITRAVAAEARVAALETERDKANAMLDRIGTQAHMDAIAAAKRVAALTAAIQRFCNAHDKDRLSSATALNYATLRDAVLREGTTK